MTELLIRLASVNSFTHHTAGLNTVADILQHEFSSLSPDVSVRTPLPDSALLSASGEMIHQPLGPLLSFSKRPEAPVQVLLVIHYDTVYPPEHGFQSVRQVDERTLNGPGVADAKGGIVVMLHALRAFESLPCAARVGWRVMLNPDEEIGSPGSAAHLVEAARGVRLALVFEPAPSPTALVTSRKGSGNFSVVFRGRSAHAGRDIEKGRNAVLAAARFGLEATRILSTLPGVTINVARIDGGGPANVVPDLAILRFNVRVNEAAQQREVEQRLADLLAEANQQDGISAKPHGHFSSPPWVMNWANRAVFEELLATAREQGLELHATTSGGASDANKIASTGVACLDSLGPVGAHIHSENETVDLPSLPQRAALVARFLEKIAAGQIALPATSCP